MKLRLAIITVVAAGVLTLSATPVLPIDRPILPLTASHTTVITTLTHHVFDSMVDRFSRFLLRSQVKTGTISIILVQV